MDSKEIEKRRLTLDDHMHLTKDGVEFWYAREVIGVFGYTQWRRFEETIKRAMISLESSKTPVRDHFADIGKMVPLGSGAERLVKDYMLTRYACYLIAQNGDPRKEEIAFAQSYFAFQTRKQELIEQRMLELRRLTEKECTRGGREEAEAQGGGRRAKAQARRVRVRVGVAGPVGTDPFCRFGRRPRFLDYGAAPSARNDIDGLSSRAKRTKQSPPVISSEAAEGSAVEKSPANRLQTSVTSPNRPPPRNLLRNRIAG